MLQNENLNLSQSEFKEIKLLIIDEFSMLSLAMFGKIDQRIRQAQNNNLLLGGISTILIGKFNLENYLVQMNYKK